MHDRVSKKVKEAECIRVCEVKDAFRADILTDDPGEMLSGVNCQQILYPEK